MIPELKLKISLKELSLRGQMIIAQQSETSYLQAIQQVQRLKQTSKVRPAIKKSGLIG